jgi:hypothetical protein
MDITATYDAPYREGMWFTRRAQGLSIRANHGGGWQYRLCPYNPKANLTEACFQEVPLAFASDHHTLEWNDGSQMRIPARYITEGTQPHGSAWVQNPLPYSNSRAAPEFPPPCNETVDRKHSDTGRCSGRDPFDVLILNTLQVPKDITPGEWVLGLRWDCESEPGPAAPGSLVLSLFLHCFCPSASISISLGQSCPPVPALCRAACGDLECLLVRGAQRARKSGSRARISRTYPRRPLCSCAGRLWV